MRLGILAAAGLLAGCAGAAWFHPNYQSGASAARHFEIDDARCTASAYGASPARPIPSMGGGQSTTYVEGSIDGPRGRSSYTGTTRTDDQPGAAGGFAQGYDAASAAQASGVRKKIWRGCMMSLGWTTSEEDAERRASGYDVFETR